MGDLKGLKRRWWWLISSGTLHRIDD